MKKFEQYINGEFSSGGEYFESVNPANGQVWAKFPAASEEETKLAIESAHKALFKGEWASYTATQRGKLLHKLGNLIADSKYSPPLLNSPLMYCSNFFIFSIFLITA